MVGSNTAWVRIGVRGLAPDIYHAANCIRINSCSYELTPMAAHIKGISGLVRRKCVCILAVFGWEVRMCVIRGHPKAGARWVVIAVCTCMYLYCIVV